MIYYTYEEGGQIIPFLFSTRRQIIIRQLRRNLTSDYNGGKMSHIKVPGGYIIRVRSVFFTRNGRLIGIWDANRGDYRRWPKSGKRVTSKEVPYFASSNPMLRLKTYQRMRDQGLLKLRWHIFRESESPPTFEWREMFGNWEKEADD